LFEILRILFGWRTRPAQTRPVPERSTRLQVEELEHRALPSVFGLLRAFQIHLADISGDVTRASDAVTALSTAVGLNAKPAVTADINTLTTDAGTLAADLAAGKNVSADISKLIGDQVQTALDLGQHMPGTVRRDLRHLRHDLRDLAKDQTLLNAFATRIMRDVERDSTRLANLLGANVPSGVSQDLQTLQTDLATIAADMLSGTDMSGDVNTAIQDAKTLTADLVSNPSFRVQNKLIDISADLNDLSQAAVFQKI
jgi:hypothetical protein